jgi:cyclohexanone monooxygenase
MVTSIEQHADWIADCLNYMKRSGFSEIEATEAAQEAWVTHSNEVAGRTLMTQANSWYLGANVPGKPRIFMPYLGGAAAYKGKLGEVAERKYEGFELA